MEIKYLKELGNNYMVIGAGPQKNEYAYRIIAENQIDGLLQVSRSNFNGKIDYYYEINGKTSIDRFYAKKAIEYDDLKNLMMAVARLPEALDEYLIDKSCILLELETVFLDGKGNIFFTLYPDAKGDFLTGIKEIAAFVLTKVNHQDAKCVTAAYQIFEIAGRDSFGMEEIAEVFGCEKEVEDRGFEDEILAFNEEEYGIVLEDDDIFEAEEDELDEDFGNGLKPLPDSKEPENLLARAKNRITDIMPVLIIVVAGIFLFVTPAASSMTLGIKIVCFVMVCAAMVLIRMLLKDRFNSEK